MNTTTRVMLVAAWGLVAGLPFGCASEKKPAETTLRDGRVQRTGFLQNDIVAIGGETTGWALATGKDRTTWQEVDVSKVADAANRMKSRRVIITGALETRNYTTRGPVSTLVADVIVLDEATSQELNAGNLPIPPSPSRR